MKSFKYKIIVISTLLLNSSGLLADTLADTLLKRSSLTGEWRGYRRKLTDNGVYFTVDYTSDLFSNVTGGISSESVYLDNTDVKLSLEMETLTNWKETEIFFLFSWIQRRESERTDRRYPDFE